MYHWIGGFASATNFIPFRGIKRWSWEIYWLIQGFAAWIIAPLVLASLLVPHLSSVMHSAYAADPRALRYAMLFGALWGVGGLTFGLAIRYLGIALGYAIALGLCTVFGTLIPPIYDGSIRTVMHETSGQIILAGVLVCLIAVAVNGAAGISKDREFTPEDKAEAGESEFSFGKGLAIAVLAGIMSSFFAFGLDAGKPHRRSSPRQQLARSGGKSDLWSEPSRADRRPLAGGLITNLVWSAILIFKQPQLSASSLGEPGRNPMGTASGQPRETRSWIFDPRGGLPPASAWQPRTVLTRNYLLRRAWQGIIWYFQFFFYSMGQHPKMGKFDFASWTLHMASIIIFANALGPCPPKEWKGTSARTKMLVAAGLFLLVGSTVIVGYGNYYHAVQETAKTAAVR